MNPKVKYCRHCHTEKPLVEMEKDKRSPGGYRSRCKLCKSEYDKSARLRKRKGAAPDILDKVPGYVATFVTQRSIELFAAAGYSEFEIAALCR